LAPDAVAASRRTDIEALHLAVRIVERTQCGATEGFTVRKSQQQGSVLSRQRGELFGKPLEAKVHAERRLVLRKQLARRLHVLRAGCLANSNHA
jgi:hypothetical protein